MTSQVLTSWKEIANYLGKGVRTVQRWEAEMGLPVRRPGPERHIVIAFPAELDEWIRRPELRDNGAGEYADLVTGARSTMVRSATVHRHSHAELEKMRALLKTMLIRLEVNRAHAVRLANHFGRLNNKKVMERGLEQSA